MNAFDNGGESRATVLALSHTQGLDCQPSDTHWPTLRGEGGGMAVTDPVAAVRRLTPVEVERLMGWPDDHTAWGVDEDGDRKDMPDSTRYRMVGNGVMAPVAEWIGRQLIEVA